MATDLLPGFEETSYVTGLDLTTAMEFSPDGRLFVLEKNGNVRVVRDGTLLPTPFLTLAVNTEAENGLNGIVFDKDFNENGFVYLHYTYTRTDGNNANRISRFKVSNSNADLADPNSEVVILDNIILPTGLHSTGTMHYGPDGMLYVSVGDRGATNEVQQLSSLAGKLLRIDPSAYPNIVPQDNPFVGVPGARGEIYALGFRNPFTFAISPEDGTILLNDVGSVYWEEINHVVAGGNYGWPGIEGAGNNPAYIDPVFTYAHDQTGAGAITGGTFYTGNQYPTEFQNVYFFTDFIFQSIRTLKFEEDGHADHEHVLIEDFATGMPSAIDLDMGPDGSLYYINIFGGQVNKISYVGGANRSPVAVATATPAYGDTPLWVQFDATGSSDPDQDSLTYVWDFGDGSAPGYGATPGHLYSSRGIYQARVTAYDGNGGEDTSDGVLVAVGEHPPTATINLVMPHALYHAGDTVQFSASAFDIEDGALPASAYSWSVSFHHLDHVHPYLGPINGVADGSFTIPVTGESSSQVWYRIKLTVTDTAGLKHETYQDIHPQVVTVTLNTNVPGLNLELDGSPHAGPYTFTGVAGLQRTIAGQLLQVSGNKTYMFQSWSDGGLQAHTLVTPSSDTTLTVNYAELTGDRLSPSYFVAGLYEDLLRRKASAVELNQHVNSLVSGQPRSAVVSTIWGSAEARGLLVRDAYNEVYGRLPNAGELTAGINSINSTGSTAALVASLVGDPEYWSFDKPQNNQYVAGVYQTILHRVAAPAEVQAWVNLLNGGMTRTAMATFVANSGERIQLTLGGFYQTFLNRPLDGFAASYWLSAVQVGGAKLDDVAKAILSSPEYQSKMVAPVAVQAMFDNILHRYPLPAETVYLTNLVETTLPREGLANALYLAAERLYNLTVQAFTGLVNRQPTTTEVNTWTQAMLAGTPYAQLVGELASSAEFNGLYPSNAAAVQKIYPVVLGRSADAQGMNNWVAALNAGTTRAAMVQALYNSTEYLAKTVDTSYREYLGRAATTAERNSWVSQIQKGQASVNSFNVALLSSDEYWSKAQPRYMTALAAQQSNASVIASLYTELLNRAGSQTEINAWLGQLAQGMSMTTVINAFWTSGEHRTVQAKAVYQDLLNRLPNANELSAAVTQLAAGGSTVNLANSLLNSTEYSTAYVSNSDFVDALYLDVLGRAADPFGKNAWVAALNGGLSRSAAISTFQGTDEAWTRVVDLLYSDLLDRHVDVLGATYWTSMLKTGQKKIDELGLALVGSAEYFSLHD
ncbi:MAG: DUF4214 domain-containing protein [Pirellulales bacterium]|nr:DUF4214 domain-containing protein [Pirellulales bacterium]